MSNAGTLVERMRAEFSSRDARIKGLQKDQLQQFQDREQRLEQFAEVCEELKGIWGPKLQTFAEQFGDKVKVTPKVTPSARQASMAFMTELANVRMTLSATTDHEMSKLVLEYDLEIIPVLMEYERHAKLEQPLDDVDREAVAEWIDDRLIDFVRNYLSLHENEFYLKRHMVQDPVAGVRFPKHAAAASLEWNGKTYYFIGEQTMEEFKKRESISAAEAPLAGVHMVAESKEVKKLSTKEYERELEKLQVKLCLMQAWIKQSGHRVIIVLEGRDAAGKGGTIKAITERVSPRVFRLVALPAPSDREKSQMYMQRYMPHFPAAGEVVIYDRSWYNRAGVEYVMGFCTKEQHKRFLKLCPEIERYITDSGIQLIKIWLEVSDKEQKRRFEARITDPLRQWKLSPMDLPSRSKWFEYSRARDMMLDATDTRHAPWRILVSDDKRRARLNCIHHIVDLVPWKRVPQEKVKLPRRKMKGAYDDQASLKGRRFVPSVY